MARTMTVAVTGASGFLGRFVCRALAEREYRTVGIGHAGSARRWPEDLRERIETRDCDVLDRGSVDAALTGADAVVHCAAVVAIGNEQQHRTKAVNATGTHNVLQSCIALGIPRLVHIGSVHAHGSMRGKQLNRNSQMASGSPLAYSASKAQAQESALREMSQGRIGGCIVCPSGIIGPADEQPTAVGSMILDIARRRLPMLVNAGYWWCDVRDVADAVAEAVACGGDGAVYFTPGRYAKLEQLAEMCSATLGRDVTRPAVPYWVAVASLPLVRAYASARRLSPLYTRESLSLVRNCPDTVDDSNAKNEIGYRARPLEDTVRDAVTWFQDNGRLD